MTVRRLLAGDHPVGGRAYATYLERLAGVLRDKYGTSTRHAGARFKKQQRTVHAISEIILTHPDWTSKQVSDTLGLNIKTVHRYAALIREKYDLPTPKPGRPRKDVPTGEEQGT
jgi:hypothetical protein